MREIGCADLLAVIDRRLSFADDPATAGAARRAGRRLVAGQFPPELIDALLPRGAFLAQTRLHLRYGFVRRLSQSRMAQPGERQCDQAASHGRRPTVVEFALIHSCAALKRAMPGTRALRLTSFHFGSNPAACSLSMRPKR